MFAKRRASPELWWWSAGERVADMATTNNTCTSSECLIKLLSAVGIFN
jgi:hypothetical protein